MKILIADDQQIIRFGLKLILKSLWENVEITEVEDLSGVVSSILIDNFDLIVLDICMPGSEDLENVIRFMLMEVKVIVFTGVEKTNSRVKSLSEAGVNLFIFKDSTIDGIKNELRNIL